MNVTTGDVFDELAGSLGSDFGQLSRAAEVAADLLGGTRSLERFFRAFSVNVLTIQNA